MSESIKAVFESNPIKIELDNNTGIVKIYNPDVNPEYEVPVEIFPDMLPAVLEVLQNIAKERI